MKTKDKLLLSMMLLMHTSCSNTETGVITLKRDSVTYVRLTDDTTTFRVLDFTAVNNLKRVQGGKIKGCIVCQALNKGDTIVFQNADADAFIMVRNWKQIREINSMTIHEISHNLTNTK